MFSDRKDEGDVMETRLSGNAFQILAAATGKARLPTVESLKGGTTRRLVPEERSERQPDISVTRLSGPRYDAGRDATENFVGQHGDLEFHPLRNPQPM